MTLENAIAEIEAKARIMAEVLVDEGVELDDTMKAFSAEYLERHLSDDARQIIKQEVLAGRGNILADTIRSTLAKAGTA